jgi:hypothetical protein
MNSPLYFAGAPIPCGVSESLTGGNDHSESHLPWEYGG